MGLGRVAPAGLLGELLDQEAAVNERKRAEEGFEPVAWDYRAEHDRARFQELIRELLNPPRPADSAS